MEQKTFFFQKSKRGYKGLLFILLRQVSNKRIKTSINHLTPCSQEIIDHENPDFFTFFFRYEMKLFGCYGNTVMIFFYVATMDII